jgi:hypothetical protein
MAVTRRRIESSLGNSPATRLRRLIWRLRFSHMLEVLRRRRVEWQVEVVENDSGAVVDVHLAHASALHHGVVGDEVEN